MKRVLLFFAIFLLALAAWAERPAHRPQTIAENFLRAMQVRDFQQARDCIVPSQYEQFALIVNWSDLSGWFAAASEPSDFPVLRSIRTKSDMTIDYDLGERGTARILMLKINNAWFLDLTGTNFRLVGQTDDKPLIQAANSNRNPRDRAKLFLEALTRADFGDAARVGTPRTASILKLIASFAPYGEKKADAASAIEIISENIDGYNATVEYRGSDGKQRSVDLIKVGADWMVDLSTDQMDF